MTSLDIDLLRSFVAVADLANFTEAGDRLGATQSAMSLRLKKLEDRLGRRLADRTPRSVALTSFGETFLVEARRILAVHDAALARLSGSDGPNRIALGVSEHAAGTRLPAILAALKLGLPGVRIEMRLGLSETLLADHAAGRLDAVVARRIGGKGEAGRLLYRDDLVWMASPALDWRPGDPVPLVAIGKPCGVCAAAETALSAAGMEVIEAFSSPGLAAVQAAVAAGLGIGCLGRTAMPAGAIELGPEAALPPLPESEIVMVSRRTDPRLRAALDRVAEAFRAPGPRDLR